MAQSFTGTSGTFYVPGSYVETIVQAPNSGLSTTGVLMLIGEADAGPSYSEESDISLNRIWTRRLLSDSCQIPLWPNSRWVPRRSQCCERSEYPRRATKNFHFQN
jgi:hypothetical protein